MPTRMERLSDPRREIWLRLVLVGICAHSALVGVGLMVQPAALLDRAGYEPLTEPFFARQGGVFHILMAVAYAGAVAGPWSRRTLIPFAILVKTVAACFLLTHWLLVRGAWVVPVSGLVDGLMAVVLWWSWARKPEAGSTP